MGLPPNGDGVVMTKDIKRPDLVPPSPHSSLARGAFRNPKPLQDIPVPDDGLQHLETKGNVRSNEDLPLVEDDHVCKYLKRLAIYKFKEPNRMLPGEVPEE